MKKLLNKKFGCCRNGLLVSMFLLTLLLGACSDNDEPQNRGIVGQWISYSPGYERYYRFDADGTGIYIGLMDEPGFDPENPDAVINHPCDPIELVYEINGDTLTIVESWRDITYEPAHYLMDLSENILQIKRTDYSYSKWETYLRWESKSK